MAVYRTGEKSAADPPGASVRLDDEPVSKPSRMPLLLSAVFPGIGQFAQNRTSAGLLYFLTTLGALVMFVVETVRLLSTYYRLMFENVPTTPSAVNMLLWFVITLGIYFISLWDTHRAYNAAIASYSRSRAKDREKELMVSPPASASPPPLPSDAETR